MPALAMAIVYFGYIARMARAGTIEVLQSDYTRTATMKGLTTAQTMRHHVLRNALVPTVAVIAVQIGYLFGGIIAVEQIFNYNGMGATMLFAAERKDLPMLTAGVLVIGIVYMVATLAADLITAWMNPRIRLGRGPLMDLTVTPAPDAPIAVSASSERSQARRETLRVLVRRPAFIIGDTRDARAGSSAPSWASGSPRTIRSTTSRTATCRPAPNTSSGRIGSVGTSCRGSWSGPATC